jgi:hypothetical protein
LGNLHHVKHRSWENFRHSVRSLWSKKEIDAIAKRLETYRNELVLRVLVSLKDNFDSHSVRQDARFDSLLQESKAIVQSILEHRQLLVAELRAQTKRQSQRVSFGNASAVESHQGIIAPLDGSQYQLAEAQADFPELTRSAHLRDPYTVQKRVLRWLKFRKMTDRKEEICEPYQETFQWIYRNPQDHDLPWSDFSDWLKNGAGCYWINGKAGSGKSTLMKYICDDRRTYAALSSWAGTQDLVIASFFFWNGGTTMQKSQTGLLQSILHEVLERREDMIPVIFPDLWDVDAGYPVDWDFSAPSRVEMKKAFLRLVRQEAIPIRLALLIDGIDEYDGDHSALAGLFKSITSSSKVKVLLSSRPILAYEDAFSLCPKLRLQDLTYRDIKFYTNEQLNDHARMRSLIKQEPERAPRLVTEVVNKAEGVFLWVTLVVKSLLNGLQNYDRISDLQKRLDELPPDLEGLYRHMLDRISTIYLSQASRLLQLISQGMSIELYHPFTPLALSFADEDDPMLTKKTLPTPGPLMQDWQLSRCLEMNGRLKSRCCGLIEIKYKRSGVNRELDLLDSEVQCLHRTVKEFLDKPDVRNYLTSLTFGTGFDVNASLLRSCILRIRIATTSRQYDEAAWKCGQAGMIVCRLAEQSTGKAYGNLLDELDKSMTSHWMADYSAKSFRSRRSTADGHWTENWPTVIRRDYRWYTDFSSFAVEHGLIQYVKAREAQYKQRDRRRRGRPYLDFAVSPAEPLEPYREQCISPDMCRLLLRYGANPNERVYSQSPWRNTLCFAGQIWSLYDEHLKPHWKDSLVSNIKRWAEILELLVTYGADPYVQVETALGASSGMRLHSPEDVILYAFIEGPKSILEPYEYAPVRKMGEDLLRLLEEKRGRKRMEREIYGVNRDFKRQR